MGQAAECNGLLKALAQKIEAGEDSQEFAEAMFSSLKALVVAFLGAYFGTVDSQVPHPRPNEAKGQRRKSLSFPSPTEDCGDRLQRESIGIR